MEIGKDRPVRQNHSHPFDWDLSGFGGFRGSKVELDIRLRS
jgi:hypothetical protein